MEQAGALDLKPAEMWELTLRELALYMRGRNQANLDAWRRGVWAAWHGACFYRTKRLSGQSLKRVFRQLEQPGERRQTPEQMYQMAKLWTAALGGKIKEAN